MTLVFARPEDPYVASDRGTIELGLLNNLGDAGLERGERQFASLLRDLAFPRPVRLRLFTLRSIPRGAAARSRIAEAYTDISKVMAHRLDGLIVTGCEPGAARLNAEGFWSELTDVVDWAERSTRSTIWSCLAAHAAVFHLDGVERTRLAEKCTGLYPISREREHSLLAGLPEVSEVPHSRWNDLARGDLEATGYDVLTRGDEIGVDTFVKQWRSLFVYFQGHPEYDADALAREYRRDVLRFLDGTAETYPSLPQHYFDRETEERLAAFERRAHGERDPRLVADIPLKRAMPGRHRSFAASLYRNWLSHLIETVPLDAL